MTMIQIRNVPEDLHRQLKLKAVAAGMSLSEYLLREIRESTARPTLEEMRVRLAGRTPVNTTPNAADAVRAERDGR